jgi:cell division protein FtsL
MTFENQNAAYDLDLFKDNTAKKLPKKEEKAKNKNDNKVVTIPQEEIFKIRKRKHNPFKLFVGGVSSAVATVVIAAIIVGQVQLTELNQKVITAQETLADVQSEYTQLQMSVQSKLSTSEIEKYAEESLGMSKAENAQKEFVSLSTGDKAEISSDANLNFFQKIFNAFTGLWS